MKETTKKEQKQTAKDFNSFLEFKITFSFNTTLPVKYKNNKKENLVSQVPWKCFIHVLKIGIDWY